MTAEIRSEMVFVTPEMAKGFLLCNEQNRRIRDGWVDYLAKIILHNEWQATHQGIAFSESGRLLDGQHRLLAIVKADIPVNILVTYGVPSQTFAAIDSGIKRTDSDLTMLPKTLTEVSKFFIYVMGFEGLEDTAKKGNGRKVTPSQIKAYADVLSVFCDFIQKKSSTRAKVFGSTAGVSAAIAAMMMGESPDYVVTLYRQLVLGNTQHMPPIGHSAVRQVLNGTMTTKGGGEARLDVFAKMLAIFKEANKNNMKLVMRDRQSVLNEVRHNLKPWFSPEGQQQVRHKVESIRSAVNE